MNRTCDHVVLNGNTIVKIVGSGLGEGLTKTTCAWQRPMLFPCSYLEGSLDVARAFLRGAPTD
jgi:hypothetical protein